MKRHARLPVYLYPNQYLTSRDVSNKPGERIYVRSVRSDHYTTKYGLHTINLFGCVILGHKYFNYSIKNIKFVFLFPSSEFFFFFFFNGVGTANVRSEDIAQNAFDVVVAGGSRRSRIRSLFRWRDQLQHELASLGVFTWRRTKKKKLNLLLFIGL